MLTLDVLIVDDKTEFSVLECLAETDTVTLDVTNLDLRKLPAKVKASLRYLSAEDFVLPQLQSVGHICAWYTKELLCPIA